MFTAICSDAGVQGAEGFAAYCAPKHGVVGLVRCLALDHGPQGVRANAVCQGFYARVLELPFATVVFAALLEWLRRAGGGGRFSTDRAPACPLRHEERGSRIRNPVTDAYAKALEARRVVVTRHALEGVDHYFGHTGPVEAGRGTIQLMATTLRTALSA